MSKRRTYLPQCGAAHRVGAGAAGAGHGVPNRAGGVSGQRGHGSLPADSGAVHGCSSRSPRRASMWRRRGWRRKAWPAAAAWPRPRGLCITALGFGTAAMLTQSVLAGPCARYLLRRPCRDRAADFGPQSAVYGRVGRGAGVLLAARRVQPNITAQLIEQLVRMAVAAAGLWTLAQWGAGYGCAAVLLGNTVSEASPAALCWLLPHARRNLHHGPVRRCTLHPQGAVRHPVARRGQPPAGQRPAGGGKQPDPLHTGDLHGQPRRGRGPVRQHQRVWRSRCCFSVFGAGALSGLLMPEITRAHTRATLPPCAA